MRDDRQLRSRRVRRSADVLKTPLREHLEPVKSKTFRGLLTAAGDRDLLSFLAGMSLTKRGLVALLASIGELTREGNAHAALSLVHTAQQVMPPEDRKWTALRYARLLHDLGCYAEAVDAYAQCEGLMDAGESLLGEAPADILTEYSVAAMDAGRWALGRKKAEAALAIEADHSGAIAALADASSRRRRTGEEKHTGD